MSDIGLEWDIVNADVDVVDGDLLLDNGLKTSVLISLFTDRRATAAELPHGQTDPRGWWGDIQPVVDGDLIGSKLWLLGREKETEDVRVRAIAYAAAALQWLIGDGIARAVDVDAQWIAPGTLGIGVTITRPDVDPTKFKFAYAWAALEAA